MPKFTIPKMHPDSFDWSRWRACDIFERFKVPWRESYIVANADLLRSCAVGYCRGESLACRPKSDTMAVMFIIDDEFQWCHMRNREFVEIFKE